MRFALFLLPAVVFAEAGILIPSGATEPDPATLSLHEMHVRVRIDNHHATVDTRQIFANHSTRVLEGTYTFSLPARAGVSDFAVWDGLTRIPGVILERRQAEDLYLAASQEAVDPGLLQLGDEDEEQARRTSIFTVKIAPIPAHGTKRVELQYQERIPIENLQGSFALPLRPDAYRAQSAGLLSIEFELTSRHAINAFEQIGSAYKLEVFERAPRRIRARFSGRQIALVEDFAIKYGLDPSSRDTVEVLTRRTDVSEPGFFETSAVIGPENPSARRQDKTRTVIAAMDVSLSMQWEKLERTFRALEAVLRSLSAADKFNVLLFHSDVSAFAKTPVAATPDTIEKALAFVRASELRGGTALEAALTAALDQARDPDSSIVLLTDAGATEGPQLQNRTIAAGHLRKLRAIPAAQRPWTYVFAVGDDANLPLVKMLAEERGVFEWVRSTESVDFKLAAFVSKVGRRPVEGLRLAAQPAANLDHIYPLEPSVFSGSIAAWVGRYLKPAQTTFTVQGTRGGSNLQLRKAASLPAQSADSPHLPRTWAIARVDALLAKIERDGEDKASIEEIIRLARKYKLVTPFTSFLAAPRALLRPRVIRPGDPVLRVRTDSSIGSVVALFPFGLVKPLRYLKDEDVWQTRFLAPSSMQDGTHHVRLVLRDRQGRVYRENKSFVIASKPPAVRLRLEKRAFHRGEIVRVRAGAPSTARTVLARMYGVSAVPLRWLDREKANYGEFAIPAHLPAGRYRMTVTAEDMAHNIGSQEVTIEVLP